jgi:hypothetical protein
MISGEIDCIHGENHAAHLEELWEEFPTVLKNVGECHQIVAKEVHFLAIDSEE